MNVRRPVLAMADRARRRSAVCAAAAAVAAGLTACSVDLVDAGRSSTSPSPEPRSAPGLSVPPPPTSSSASGRPTSSSDVPTAAQLRRRFAGDIVKQLDCAGGSITVSGAGMVAELTQPCDHVTVDGSGIVLFAQRIGSLDVGAASSLVLATSITTVTTDGAGVEVYWTSGQPTISDSGAGTVARRIEEK